MHAFGKHLWPLRDGKKVMGLTYTKHRAIFHILSIWKQPQSIGIIIILTSFMKTKNIKSPVQGV